MPLYSLVPSFRPLLAPIPRLRFRTDTQTDRQTHTQDNYRNPPAHARRGLIIMLKLLACINFNEKARGLCISVRGKAYTLTWSATMPSPSGQLQSFRQREINVNLFARLHHLSVRKDVEMAARTGSEQVELPRERE